ncbi:hypothetical protein BDQ17DRAFT_1440559 [Cyathus striatus]|nr:hypothetical protein BDQ17DRAFT_1440559 [Cyathus striatus]
MPSTSSTILPLQDPLNVGSNNPTMEYGEVLVTAPVVSIPQFVSVTARGSLDPPTTNVDDAGSNDPVPAGEGMPMDRRSNDPPSIGEGTSSTPLDMEVDDGAWPYCPLMPQPPAHSPPPSGLSSA